MFCSDSERGRKTKIVATIGPATNSAEMVARLLSAGMDVARLNFAHGTLEEHARTINLLRQAAAQLGRSLAILQDLPGPRNRIGKLPGGEAILETGKEVILTTRPGSGDGLRVPVSLPNLPQDVTPGNTIFLADGAIQLQVLETTGSEVRCHIVHGGLLKSDKGINVPGVTLNVPTLTPRDWEYLSFGLEQGVDLVALSFVRRARQVLEVKDFLRWKGAEVVLIAKIEKHEALKDIDGILEAADGVMVARGDLGVEIPLPQVPLAQKEIVRKSNERGKPVIVATQMLESMMESPRPTRAEVTDVANAIFDGCDAVMLSGETAIGRYPLEAVKMMASIATEAERALPYEQWLLEKGRHLEPETDEAISYAACHTAHQLGAKAIVAFTFSGSTARRVAKYRPRVPILAITPQEKVQRQLALSWAVHPCLAPQPESVDHLFNLAIRLAAEKGLAQPKELVVITAGLPIGVPGGTNLLRVARIE